MTRPRRQLGAGRLRQMSTVARLGVGGEVPLTFEELPRLRRLAGLEEVVLYFATEEAGDEAQSGWLLDRRVPGATQRLLASASAAELAATLAELELGPPLPQRVTVLLPVLECWAERLHDRYVPCLLQLHAEAPGALRSRLANAEATLERAGLVDPRLAHVVLDA